ncbi:hypothetical protein [Hyphococcus aureus]|uniref:Uncharacterized protein n=1 Tax=Hyphococcus aureus TaxID=2666033 RepID=A0ABW1L4N8_9PROT
MISVIAERAAILTEWTAIRSKRSAIAAKRAIGKGIKRRRQHLYADIEVEAAKPEAAARLAKLIRRHGLFIQLKQACGKKIIRLARNGCAQGNQAGGAHDAGGFHEEHYRTSTMVLIVKPEKDGRV